MVAPGAGVVVSRPAWSPVGRVIHRATLPARRALLRRRLGRLALTEVEGVPLVVLPQVFHPGVFRTTGVLVRAMRLAGGIGRDTRVLDLGTGTGVLGVVAATLGAAVTALDINPDAVRCARINALLNRVDDRMTVVEGDLFDAVTARVDLVLFNPPFFSGPPSDAIDRAWRSVDVLDRFAAGLDGGLTPLGRALVAFSSHGDEARFLSVLGEAGLDVRRGHAEDLGDEIVTVFDIRRGRVQR
jgi:HemK-related putative methylase